VKVTGPLGTGEEVAAGTMVGAGLCVAAWVAGAAEGPPLLPAGAPAAQPARDRTPAVMAARKKGALCCGCMGMPFKTTPSSSWGTVRNPSLSAVPVGFTQARGVGRAKSGTAKLPAARGRAINPSICYIWEREVTSGPICEVYWAWSDPALLSGGRISAARCPPGSLPSARFPLRPPAA
jgi:hypothetical protein